MARAYPINSSAAAVTLPGVNDYDLLRFQTNFLNEGVISGFAVSQRAAGANMSVDIAAGLALIEITNTNVSHGRTYKTWFEETVVTNKTITTADATNPRKDRVVLRIDVSTDPNAAASNIAVIEVLAGTPAGSPSAPSEPANAITLAIVDIPASDTAIADAQITDSRTYATTISTTLRDIARQGLSNSIAAGSGTNTVTATYTPTVTALTDKLLLWVIPANDNTGAATFSPDGLTAHDIVKYGATALEAGDLKAKVAALLQYNTTDSNWKLLTLLGNSPAVANLTISEKTADYSVTAAAAEQNKVFDNKGATSSLDFTLPAAAAGYNYHFAVYASQVLRIIPAAGDTLTLGASQTSSTSPALYSNTPYSIIRVVALDSDVWAAISSAGTWALATLKGYFLGGSTGSRTAVIEDMNFSTETSAAIAATLDTAKTNGTGVSSTKKGYILGGNTGSAIAVIEDIVFLAETSAAIAATLDSAKELGAGVQSTTKGYILGGESGGTKSAVIENLVFSGETSAAIAATLDTAKGSGTGVSSATKGYIMGGEIPAATAVIEDLAFSGETSAAIAATLDTAKSAAAGAQSATKGYILGGYTGAASNVIENLVFSGETSAAIGATLPTAKYYPAGVSSATKGYVMGGLTPEKTEIAALTFSSETTATISATLDTAKASGAGVYAM